MALVELPGRRIRRNFNPDFSVEVDKNNALVNRHQRLYVLAGPQARKNILTDRSISNTPPAVITDRGLAANFNGTDVITTETLSAHTGPWTAWAVVRTTTTTGVRNIFSYGSGTAYSFQLRQNNTNYEAYQYDGADKQALDSGGVLVNEFQFIAASWNGTTLSVWRNMDWRGSVGVSALSRAADTLMIGRENLATQWWLGQIQYLGFAARALSSPELMSLESRTTQILRPKSRRIWVPVSAGGATFTVNARRTIIAGAAATKDITTTSSAHDVMRGSGVALKNAITAASARTVAAGSVAASKNATAMADARTLARGAATTSKSALGTASALALLRALSVAGPAVAGFSVNARRIMLAASGATKNITATVSAIDVLMGNAAAAKSVQAFINVRAALRAAASTGAFSFGDFVHARQEQTMLTARQENTSLVVRAEKADVRVN